MFLLKKRAEVIRLKALVDKENNRVIFAEASADFIDVLLSLLTMPMGTIIRLTCQPPATRIGCMNNLYESVENLDKKYFRTEACKIMLLNPQNGTAAQCESLKLKIDDPLRYFLCSSSDCTLYEYKFLSHYRNMRCGCGNPMNSERVLFEKKSDKTVSNAQDGGIFVKGQTLLLVSDELQVTPPSTATCFSLLSKCGVMDASTTEERIFDVGVNEVLKLLKCSFVSKTPLTETLLKHNPVTELSKDDFDQGSFIKSHMKENSSNENGRICVKLIVCKSKQMVSYAEVGEDFVDLLFSFLTLPLGYIGKHTHGCSLNRCINHLYDSVQDLDTELYFKSNDHKAMLVRPKLAPGFSYENQPLGIGEYISPPYYYRKKNKILTTVSSSDWNYSELSVMDPKPHYNEDASDNELYVTGGVMYLTSNKIHVPSVHWGRNLQSSVVDPNSRNRAESRGGYVTGAAMFTVTDDLIITPMSPISGLSILNKLKVPLSDMEERNVYVGNEEALRLLVASFVSKSALTNTFILREPKQEYQGNAS